MANLDLYPQSRSPSLDPALFRDPPAAYRGAPFWSWNTRLSIPQLMRQIDVFKQMGMGGFHIHSRTGLATEYLGPEFMDAVKASVEKAREEGMRCYLYDEDRWPSGFAGGLVTREPRFRSRHLLWTQTPYRPERRERPGVNVSVAGGIRQENGKLLATFAVRLEDGWLTDYRRLESGESAGEGFQTWYAYLEHSGDVPWFNNQAYVDTLNPEAIAAFIASTHERYAALLQDDFGDLVPSIFTDEPQFPHKSFFDRSDDVRDLTIPWTTGFGASIADALPEVFWELPNEQPSAARYCYHEEIAETFATSFADQIGDWCTAHGIALTGHMMEEPTLFSQTHALGDAMRSYRAFHVPGIDMLCDHHEYTTAKQAQSAVHQYGRSGMMCEIYGVTNWDFDFKGHKGAGDWQAALGVTLRVHHLAWVSMAGEAKRDYPASISYQSPWHGEYAVVEDYFARLNVALTRGRPAVRIGVIHPIESYWLDFGPLDKTAIRRQQGEDTFQHLTEWLLFGLVDFDFIAESLLEHQQPHLPESDVFQVGDMAYQVMVVPPLTTLRSTTRDRLNAFAGQGGTVLYLDHLPTYIDAQPATWAAEAVLPFSRGALGGALEPWREVRAQLQDGSPANTLLYQLREEDDGSRILFLCNTDREHDLPAVAISVRGQWAVSHLDPHSGQIGPLGASIEGGWTSWIHDLHAHGSLLVQLTPGTPEAAKPYPVRERIEYARLEDPIPVTLEEPNVLLLDQAEWRWNDEAWQPREEVLRIDNRIRERFGLPPRMAGVAQPWAVQDPDEPIGRLTLRFRLASEVGVTDVELALEQPERCTLALDGAEVPMQHIGWYVDEAIRRIPLPDIGVGEHHLELAITFSRTTDVEACYLLGDFGARVAGRHAVLTAPVRTLAFGDITTQGLPFYGGNLVYHCTAPPLADLEHPVLAFGDFAAPLLAVRCEDGDWQQVAFAPFEAVLAAGPIDIRAFGNRHNTFAALHNIDPDNRWYGPDYWRSTDRQWAYEYQLKPAGVLTAPMICTYHTVSGEDGFVLRTRH